MAPVDFGAALAVGYGQPAAVYKLIGQRRYQAGRVAEVGEGVVDHAAVKGEREKSLFHVGVHQLDAGVGKLLPGPGNHPRGDVYAGYPGYFALQVIREEDARPAGHVEYGYAFPDCGVVEDGIDNGRIIRGLFIPALGQAVEESDDFLFIHDPHLYKRDYLYLNKRG